MTVVALNLTEWVGPRSDATPRCGYGYATRRCDVTLRLWTLRFTRFVAHTAEVQDEAQRDRGDCSADELKLKTELVGRISWRDERKNNTRKYDQKSETAGDPDAHLTARDQHGLRVFKAILAPRQLDGRGIHVKKRNEI